MTWKDDRTLTFDDGGPSALHVHTLATALRDAVGDQPGVRFLGGVLISLHFPADIDTAAKSAVEAIVAAHDGTAALADDETVAEQRRIDAEAKRADLDALRQKAESGQALTSTEQAQAIVLLLRRI